MKLPASSSRILLDGAKPSIHVAPFVCRNIRTSAPLLEARTANKPSRAKRTNEKVKQRRLTDTILTASRLGRHADSIGKDVSDRYSGWRQTPGPSTRRNVGRPKLSREAGKSLARSVASENVETLLGAHSASVLLQPLLRAEDVDDGFAAPSAGISARDFIAPRRELKPGDFVELRCSNVAVGIVLPPPDDVVSREDAKLAHRTTSGMRDLYVLVTSGQIVLYKDNDVMMQIPCVIEPSLTRVAAPTSRAHVVLSNSLDAPLNSDGSHDSHSFATAGEGDPIEGTATQEEPVDVPRFEARAAICNKMRVLERQKEKELQRLLPSFQSLFLLDQGAGSGKRMDKRTGAITTFEAARLMHEQSRGDKAFTASTVYAAHTLLMSHPTHFLADALSHRTSQLFTCRSDVERKNLQLIRQWIEDAPGSKGQSYIDAFCSKASKIRQWTEAHPHDLSGEPRAVAPPPELDVEWTPQDRSIIEFIQASLGSRRELQEDTHGSIAMEIVKRAGGHFRLLPHPDSAELMDVDTAVDTILADKKAGGIGRTMLEQVGTDVIAGGDLQHALVMRFLMSIGTLPVWQNPIRLDASFRNATMGEDGGEPEAEPTSTKGPGQMTETRARKFSLTLDDQLEAIRHDFGANHTVYVIDDEGAFELDDGISIESVDRDKAWVHIHIADPTAWIQPDSALGQRAERRFQTLYFPEARWAMLPDEFVRSGVGLRLASAAAGGDGQRVMTFSALVDVTSGLVHETKVGPALVHDVQTTSYDKVSSLLAAGDAKGDLPLLLRIATKLSENRTRSGGFLAHRPTSSVSVSPLPLPHVPVSAQALQRPYFFAGFPTINVSTRSQQSGEPSPALAQFLVSELMVLAGRVAASYGKQHKLAFAYRYQLRPASSREAQAILDMRTNLPPESTSLVSPDGMVGHGLIEFQDLLARGLQVSAGGYAAQPGEHFSLGIADAESPFAPTNQFRDAITASGYARATSPLRRYPDMLAHWQIKHHLVHGRARFPTHEIERILPQLERQEVSAKQLMRSAERYWVHALLQRSLLDCEFDAISQRTLTAKVALPEVRVNNSTLSARVRVNIEEFGLPADLLWGAKDAPPRTGEVFSVQPVAVAMAGIRSGLTVRKI